MNIKPQKISNVNSEKESFLNINQQAFIELLTFIDFADERLNIGFVEIKFSQDRNILINELLEHPKCNNIQFQVLDCSDPNLRFLRDELVTALKQIYIEPNKKLILLITGLEKSIGIVEEYPSVLTNLNFIRDDLRKSTPHPMLLFLPDYALTRLAKYAPDFWAWGRKVFTFKTNRSNLMNNSNNIIYSDDYIDSLNLQKKQTRIEQLLNLLNEYNTSGEEKTNNDLFIISSIYDQLGNAYDALGQYQKAIIFYQQGLEISIEIRDKQGEGNSLRGLGNVYYSLGQYQKAITFHQQSLDISREISDRQRQGISLGNLGNAYYSLREYQKAIAFHQQSLDISREIRNKREEVASLANLGLVYYSLGQYRKAINYHQQSLKISREIGNRLGETASLGNLGLAYYSLEQYEQAMLFDQQALEISKEIGDKRGEGIVLGNLGNVYQSLGQDDEAITYYQKSLEIRQKIGHKRGEAITWFNLGVTFDNIQRYDEAIEAFWNARKLYQDMGLNKYVEDCDNEITILESNV